MDRLRLGFRASSVKEESNFSFTLERVAPFPSDSLRLDRTRGDEAPLSGRRLRRYDAAEPTVTPRLRGEVLGVRAKRRRIHFDKSRSGARYWAR